MKYAWIGFVIIVFLAACKGEAKKEETIIGKADSSLGSVWVKAKDGIIDTVLLNKTDTAFVCKPKPIKDDIGDKRKEYLTYVYFSNKDFPILTHKNAIGASLFLCDDLDGDGKPELLLKSDWFSSCWASINLYSIKKGNWKLIKQGSMYFCSDKYPLNKRIIKTEKGYGLLTDSLTDDKFITLKKEIKF
ncbi:hypothetical protein FA048_18990 [Pedobacter polaris]|uniref:VCBS repeat-containing protein n=1 Tax=Pedobacter polaris TaxID=2571273 RepID=A0A4U1CET0_9SPHI|nr:hypothetical protein [Pedobacter polaris]TKC04769.1 hypothetical protein FA048_18990 [Pedobacter polaris]